MAKYMMGKELFQNIIDTDIQTKISTVTCNSHNVTKNSVFVALSTTAESFAEEAYSAGACLIISRNKIPSLESKSIELKIVPNTRIVYSKLCARFYKYVQPAYVTAVTGTNGKTSTTDFCRQIWLLSGIKAASIGTYGVVTAMKATTNTKPIITTPDAFDLHAELSELKNNKIDFLAFEVSSHGLHQYRADGVAINSAVFTNLSPEHSDYHKTIQNYFNAKKRLFEELLPDGGTAILNKDSRYYEKLKKVVHGKKIITFGNNADITCLSQVEVPGGQEVKLSVFGKIYNFFFRVLGQFQVENLLCAIASVLTSGINIKSESIFEKIISPLCRMELCGDFTIIDYAHTPDALLKTLLSLKRHYGQKKIITAFGCGGNRDTSKRAEMGRISSNHSYITIITDDNPRYEDPLQIRKEIMSGCRNATEIPDREQAIKTAIELAEKNDGIAFICGKGAEGYQIYGNQEIPFDDKSIAIKYLEFSA